MNDPTKPESLSEEEAARVLDRAAKLDSTRGAEVAVQTLREIALEAGISTQAFERALEEVRSGEGSVEPAFQPLRPASREPTMLGTVLRRSGIFSLGAALGALGVLLPYASGIDDLYTVTLSLVVGMFVAIALALFRRPGRRVLDFEFDLGMLWTGFTLVFLIANPEYAGEVIEIMGPIGVGAGLVGGLIVARGSGESEHEQLPEQT